MSNQSTSRPYYVDTKLRKPSYPRHLTGRSSQASIKKILYLAITGCIFSISSGCKSSTVENSKNKKLVQIGDAEILKRFSGHLIPGIRKRGIPFQQKVFHRDGRYEMQIEEPYFGTITGTYYVKNARICIFQREPECFRVFTNGNGYTFLLSDLNEKSQPYRVILQKF